MITSWNNFKLMIKTIKFMKNKIVKHWQSYLTNTFINTLNKLNKLNKLKNITSNKNHNIYEISFNTTKSSQPR